MIKSHQVNLPNNFEFLVEGFVNYSDGEKLFYSKGKTLYELRNGKSKKIISLHKNIFDKILSEYSLYLRFTRSHIQHVLPIDEKHLLIFVSGEIFFIDILKKQFIQKTKINGSQPLQIAKFCDRVYYGEYIRSRNKPPINLLKSTPPFKKWKVVKTFDNVRHIHGVFNDPYTNTLWITTGDDDSESRIIRLNETNYDVIESIGGSQMYRAVTLLFTKDYIYYGTDTPLERNYIYRIDRKTMETEKLVEVGGPVFFGTIVNHNLYFSTACEPGNYNRSDSFELWESTDGKEWKTKHTFKKDIWHNKLFRYGLIFFPSGPGDGKNLRFTTMATKNEFKVFEMPVL